MSTISTRLTLDALRPILADEARCLSLFARWRFPDGFLCPGCGSRLAFELATRRLWQCRQCRKQVSITSGTVLHRTRLPLRHWLYAIWMVANRKQSISALQLQKELGLGSYETAWTLLHKIRRALREDPTRKLQGLVDVGRAFLSNKTLRRVHGLATAEELGVAVERRPSGGTRRRASSIGELRFYRDAPTSLRQEKGQVSPSPRRWGVEPPILTVVASNLLSWLDGTFHGVSKEYLGAYLDEFAWRFNHRAHEPTLWLLLGRRLLGSPWAARAQIRHDAHASL